MDRREQMTAASQPAWTLVGLQHYNANTIATSFRSLHTTQQARTATCTATISLTSLPTIELSILFYPGLTPITVNDSRYTLRQASVSSSASTVSKMAPKGQCLCTQ